MENWENEDYERWSEMIFAERLQSVPEEMRPLPCTSGKLSFYTFYESVIINSLLFGGLIGVIMLFVICLLLTF